MTAALLVWTFWETRSTNRAQLRAYVMFDPQELTVAPNQKGLLSVQLPLRNFGQTPARDVVPNLRLDIRESRPTSEGRLPASMLTLAPGEVARVQDVFDPPPTPEQMEGLVNGTMEWWVVGTVTYRDIFNRKRSSRFCAMAKADRIFSASDEGHGFT